MPQALRQSKLECLPLASFLDFHSLMWTNEPGTNTLAYFAIAWETKKKFFNIDQRPKTF